MDIISGKNKTNAANDLYKIISTTAVAISQTMWGNMFFYDKYKSGVTKKQNNPRCFNISLKKTVTCLGVNLCDRMFLDFYIRILHYVKFIIDISVIYRKKVLKPSSVFNAVAVWNGQMYLIKLFYEFYSWLRKGFENWTSYNGITWVGKSGSSRTAR